MVKYYFGIDGYPDIDNEGCDNPAMAFERYLEWRGRFPRAEVTIHRVTPKGGKYIPIEYLCEEVRRFASGQWPA